MEDSRIVELFRERDEAAVSEAESKYGGYCRSIAMNILQSAPDAEEAVGDAMFAAWNAIPPHCPAVLSTFLGKLTRRAALTKVRDASAQKRGGGETPLALEELENCIPALSNVEQRYEEKELEAAIDRFVSTLSQADRRMFIARYWFLAPISEISEKMGCSQSKTKMTLFRTRNKLRMYLEEEGLC